MKRNAEHRRYWPDAGWYACPIDYPGLPERLPMKSSLTRFCVVPVGHLDVWDGGAWVPGTEWPPDRPVLLTEIRFSVTDELMLQFPEGVTPEEHYAAWVAENYPDGFPEAVEEKTAPADPPPSPAPKQGRASKQARRGLSVERRETQRPPSALYSRVPYDKSAGCVADGCGRKVVARGLCRAHYLLDLDRRKLTNNSA